MRSFAPSFRSAIQAIALGAAVLAASGLLPAQWTGNARKNTFAATPCNPPPDLSSVGFLALDPVLVPCNDGCFYAWIDPFGRVNVQVIDGCGYRALTAPHVVAGTSNQGGGVLSVHLTQIAGCTYADGDGAKNQMFLAYTAWDSNLSRDVLYGQCFEFTTPAGVRTLTAHPRITLQTSTSPQHGILTPVADSGFLGSTTVKGAVWGCRDTDILVGPSTMTLGVIKGPCNAITSCSMVVDPAAPWAVPLPRLRVLSDDAGGVYGSWRGATGGLDVGKGTRVDPCTSTTMVGWPVSFPANHTADDGVISRDLAGGVFAAWTDRPTSGQQSIQATHFTAAAVLSNVVAVASPPPNSLFRPFAMVAVPSNVFGTTRAALAYRSNTSIELCELSNTALTIAAGTPTVLGPVSGTADARGCATLAARGVAVGWIGDVAAGTKRTLYGQEVETTGWTKLWNKKGNFAPLVVSDNVLVENKYVPMVVPNYDRPEVIFGWIDQRTMALNPGDSTPGGYVQSVADDYLPQPAPFGLKRRDGVLGSGATCFAMRQAFGVHDRVFWFGDAFALSASPGDELFEWQGSEGGFALVADINPGPTGSNPSRGVLRGGKNVFVATTAGAGSEPWVTDGTAGGTFQLADCMPGPAGSSAFVVRPGIGSSGMDGVEVFTAIAPGTGRELWVTDGTVAGTSMVLDLNPGAGNGVMAPTDSQIGGLYYFWGNDGVHGIELWRTDGTAAGTTLVADLSPGSASTGPGGSTAVLGGRLVFSAQVAGLGAEPYVFDPVTHTVTLLGDVAPGAASSGPGFLTAAAGAVYFSADAGNGNGRELWRTDGTPAGTQPVLDIHPTGSSNPDGFADAGSFVLFRADDGVHGVELWRSDGTPAGTTMVADLLPGAGGGDPRAITAIGGGRFLFTADGSGVGREPWITDGTAAGTILLADVNPGSNGSNPQHYDLVAGTVYFDAVVGGENRTLQLALDAPAIYGEGCSGTIGQVPQIGAPGGSPHIGQTFSISVAHAAPNSLALLVYNVTGVAVPLGPCTIYVALPEIGSLLAVTDPVGYGSVGFAMPNDPSLVGLDVFWQWAVIDPVGPLLGFLSLSDAMRSTIE
jgi:ELWxxDGT repeat protein